MAMDLPEEARIWLRSRVVPEARRMVCFGIWDVLTPMVVSYLWPFDPPKNPTEVEVDSIPGRAIIGVNLKKPVFLSG